MAIKEERWPPESRSMGLVVSPAPRFALPANASARATAPTESDELRAAARRLQASVPGQTGWRGIAHKALLACGIVAPLVYLASDVIAGMRWKGYSFRDQTISELNAIGAPTRALTAERLRIRLHRRACRFGTQALGVPMVNGPGSP
jgi:hypothetical protein